MVNLRITRPGRRGLLRLGVGGLAAPLVARFAHAAEINWRIGHTAPVGFPLHIRLTEAAEAIGRLTDGRMEIRVVPDSELGSQVGLLAQVRAGTLDASPITGQALASAQATAALPMAGFAWKDHEPLWRAMDGELGKLIREQVTLSTRIVPMSRAWDFGFRVMTTANAPIRTAQDLIGLTVRTPVEADLVTLFQALKARPLAMTLADLYPALQRKQVAAQEGILPLVVAARIYAHQTYGSLTNHVWDGHWICCAAIAWNKLSDKLKDIVAKELDSAALKQREDTARTVQEARDFLTSSGMVFNTTDDKTFRETLRQAGYYKDWRTRFGDRAWEVLERYTGRLG